MIKRRCLFVLIFWLPLHQVAIASDEVIFAFQEKVPYMMDGSWGPYGLMGDLARTIAIRSGVNHRWKNMPVARQTLMMQHNSKNFCIVGATQDQYRKGKGLLSHAIFHEKGLMLFSKMDDPFISTVKTLQELLENREKILVVVGRPSENLFVTQLIKQYQPKVVKLTKNIHHAYKMIFAGHADYVIMTEQEGDYLIYQANLRRDAFQRTSFNRLPKGKAHYFLCSKKTGKTVISKINAAIESL